MLSLSDSIFSDIVSDTLSGTISGTIFRHCGSDCFEVGEICFRRCRIGRTTLMSLLSHSLVLCGLELKLTGLCFRAIILPPEIRGGCSHVYLPDVDIDREI